MKFHSFLENIHFMIFEFHSIQKNIHFLTRALYSIQNFIQFKENPCHSFKKTIHLFEKSFIEHPYPHTHTGGNEEGLRPMLGAHLPDWRPSHAVAPSAAGSSSPPACEASKGFDKSRKWPDPQLACNTQLRNKVKGNAWFWKVANSAFSEVFFSYS